MLGKQIGIIRHVDELGRFVVPKEIVNTLGWKGKTFSFKTDGYSIIVQPLDINEQGRALDSLSRLVIPKRFRKELGIKEGTKIEMCFYQKGFSLKVWEDK